MIKSKIQQRVYQILIHSCIYYNYDMNIVPDYQYDKWGEELKELIRDYPELLHEVKYGKYFKGYEDASSGFNLPYNDAWVLHKARQLLKMKNLL